MRKLILLLLLIPSVDSFAQTGKEKKILNAVNEHNAYYTSLLKEIININSGTMNFEGVQKVGAVLRKEFDKLGMETEWVNGAPFNRAGHLVARTKGSKGPKMLLIGHLDTVFEPDSPFQKYTMLNDSIMKGPGVADIKVEM